MSDAIDKQTIELIDDYLANRLLPAKRAQFEQRLASDPALKKEVDFRAELYTMMGSKEWPDTEMELDNEQLNTYRDAINTGHLSQASRSITQAAEAYHQKKSRPQIGRRTWVSVAAIAASLAMIFWLTKDDSLSDYYNDYHSWEQLPSMVEKGSQNSLIEGEVLFNDGKYTEVIELFETTYGAQDNWHPNALLYLAAAYQETESYEMAHRSYDTLIRMNVLESSRAMWFKCLLFIKQQNQSKAMQLLDDITKDPTNFNYAKALELQKQLAK